MERRPMQRSPVRTRRDFGDCPRYDKRVGETVIDWRKYLLSRRDIASGQLCAKGTRVPVAVILDSLAEGATVDEIVSSYPSLKTAHVRAAIAYAAALAREEELTPLSADAHKARREFTRRTG